MDQVNTRETSNVANELGESLSRTPGITRQKTKLGDTYLVSFDGPNDPYSPQNWSMNKKYDNHSVCYDQWKSVLTMPTEF